MKIFTKRTVDALNAKVGPTPTHRKLAALNTRGDILTNGFKTLI